MKIVGLITEYNPLHNGHVYHFNEVKKLSNADLVICVTSSSFTMRGDLSLFDKFTKTNQSLLMGIDLIIELPLIYTIERADIFSSSAIDILNLCKVNEIWIGSEENNIDIYKKYYDELNEIDNKEAFNTSYKNKANINLLSNDTLGFFYYKRIKDMNYNIELKTIKRIDNNYLDNDLSNTSISSAKSIRNNLNYLDKYVPNFVYINKDKILDENKLFDLLKYKILSTSENELKDIFFVDEGLENKLKEIINYNNLNDFIDALSNKRYTKTRIKRMLIYVLLNIKKIEANKCLDEKISFIRVLGFNKFGKEYLKSIKKNLNIYTNIKEGINDVFDIELKASKLLDSIYNLDLLKNEQKGPIYKE